MEKRFPKELYRLFEEELKKYPRERKQAALIPILYHVQRTFGYISEESEREVAVYLEISPAKVHEVTTFYTLFKRKQGGTYLIQVCTNLSCSLRGSKAIVKRLEEKLGIQMGETTPDGLFELKKVECLASCGTAPVLQVNFEDYLENLTAEKIEALIEDLKQKDPAKAVTIKGNLSEVISKQ